MLKSEVLRKKVGMEYTEYRWEGAKNKSIYAQTWYAMGTPKGVINLIHGIGEHSSRYTDWAIEFAKNGYIVRAYDLHGHGRSAGKPGNARYKLLIEDLSIFIRNGRDEFPQLPTFLYGHELGANLAINYIIDHSPKIQGLIITSPWFQLSHEPSPIRQIIQNIVSNIIPGYQVNSPVIPERISPDLKVVHNLRSDALCHQKMSVKLFNHIQLKGARAAISIYKINCQLLVMHAANNNVTSAKASQNFVRNASKKTKYIEWDNPCHELHNSPVKDEVFEKIINWMKQLPA